MCQGFFGPKKTKGISPRCELWLTQPLPLEWDVLDVPAKMRMEED